MLAIARALHCYGTPAHQLEATLLRISESLGLESQFLVTPTSIMMSVGRLPEQRTFLERVEPGETDLDKLTRLSELIKRVVRRELTTRAATEQVSAIVAAPARFGSGTTTAAYATACATAALFFGGTWRESLIAFGIGLILGLLSHVTARSPRFAGVFPAFAACFATIVSRAVASQWHPVTPFVAALGGLIVLVPGYTLTVAMNELARQHLVSGTARITGALVSFLQMGLGLALGSRVADAVWGVRPAGPQAAIVWWAMWVSLPIAAAAFMVLFRAHLRDGPGILMGSVIALAGAQFGSEWLGPVLGVALSAWLLGSYSNAIARHNGRPAATTLVPGLLVLVPGSIGFRSIEALLKHDVLSGVEIGFSMSMTAMALVTGLFLANLTVSPRRLLF